MTDNTRSIRNLFVQPTLQLRWSTYYVVVGSLILFAVAAFVLRINADVQILMNENPLMDLQTQSQINEMMRQCVEIAMLVFLLFVILSFIFALMMSHRIAGPQEAIKAYLSALAEGNYDYERRLRPTDELTEIMNAVEGLKFALKARESETTE